MAILEAMDDIVFSSTAQILRTFGKLSGRPQVLDLFVDEAGLKAWLERHKEGSPSEAARAWTIRHQERHCKKRRS
jgi:hypothetical protein